MILTFHGRLKWARESHGYSLDGAAKAAGISKTYLWELEKGVATDPSAAVVMRLADLYHMTMDRLWADRSVSDAPHVLRRAMLALERIAAEAGINLDATPIPTGQRATTGTDVGATDATTTETQTQTGTATGGPETP